MINEFPDPMTFNVDMFGVGMLGCVLEIGDHLHVITLDMEWLTSRHSELLKDPPRQGPRPWTRTQSWTRNNTASIKAKVNPC